jgi:hypothetical protein
VIRRVLLATALTAAAVLAAPTTAAQARACALGHECTTYYYSDPSRTTMVGARYEDCNGGSSGWGTWAGHRTFVEVPC